LGKKVARHSTALGERHYRCYLPVLAEFVRLPMHGTWPTRTMSRDARGASGNWRCWAARCSRPSATLAWPCLILEEARCRHAGAG